MLVEVMVQTVFGKVLGPPLRKTCNNIEICPPKKCRLDWMLVSAVIERNVLHLLPPTGFTAAGVAKGLDAISAFIKYLCEHCVTG